MAHLELEIPLGSGARELGIRPSIFVDAGAVWGVTPPVLTTAAPLYYNVPSGEYVYDPGTTENPNQLVVDPTSFKEFFGGDTPKPRISVGVGFNWNSPMGPFRIDFAKALTKDDFDDLKSFTFNVGTQF